MLIHTIFKQSNSIIMMHYYIYLMIYIIDLAKREVLRERGSEFVLRGQG